MKHKYLILLLLFSSCKSEFRNDTQQYEVVLEVIYPDRIDTLVFRGWDMETSSSRGSNELRGIYLNKKNQLRYHSFFSSTAPIRIKRSKPIL